MVRLRGAVLRHERDPAEVRARWLRRANLALLAVLAGGGVWAWLWVRDPVRFPLRTVEITGRLERVDRNVLAQRVGPVTGGGFFAVDLRAVRDAAREVPWVAGARVRRVWPDRLELHITEQQAVARWAGGGLVNAQGEIFAAAPPYPEGLPLLAGPPDQVPDIYASFRRFGRVLEKVGTLAAAARDPRGTWRLTLADGTELTLPRREASARLQRFATVYTTRLAGRVPPLASVDLRYSDGFAVRHRAAPTPPPAPSMAKL